MKDYTEYYDSCKHGGRDLLLMLNAASANRHWLVLIANILGTLVDATTMSVLGFGDVAARAMSPEEEAVLQEQMQLFYDMMVRSAGQRTWTQLTLSEIPPHCWCGVVSADVQEGNSALKQMRQDFVIINAATSDLAARPPHPENEDLTRLPIAASAASTQAIPFPDPPASTLSLQGLKQAMDSIWFRKLTMVQDLETCFLGSDH